MDNMGAWLNAIVPLPLEELTRGAPCEPPGSPRAKVSPGVGLSSSKALPTYLLGGPGRKAKHLFVVGPVASRLHQCPMEAKGDPLHGLPLGVFRPPGCSIMSGFWELAQDEVLDAPGKDGEYRIHCVPATAPTVTLKLLGDGSEKTEPLTLCPLADHIPGDRCPHA